jgi:hypothetical protein
MAGLAVPNLPCYYKDSAQRSARAGECLGGAGQFAGGGNDAGCAGPNIGVATGEVNPVMGNATNVSPTWGISRYIGLTVGANGRCELIFGADVNNQVALVQATAGVAIDGVIASGAVNKTGVALVTGDWAWGMVPVA